MTELHYIAHPVAGDVKGNILRVLAIIRQISLEEQDAIPVAPYLQCLFSLDELVLSERERGIEIGVACGNGYKAIQVHNQRNHPYFGKNEKLCISNGQGHEIRAAKKNRQKVILREPTLQPQLQEIVHTYPVTVQPFILKTEHIEAVKHIWQKHYDFAF